MYERFFELRERPFADRLDTQAFHATPDREEALAALSCAAQYAPSHVLIVGEAGVGKTLLIRTFVSRLDDAERALLLTPPAPDGPGLIHETCRRLNISATATGGPGRLLPRLQRQLARLNKEGRRPILIVDQAERLTPEQLPQLEHLAELTDGGERLLSIVLIGQPPVRQLLGQPAFARLRQMMYPELFLGAMSLNDLRGYMRGALEAVGCDNDHLFSDDSLAQLFATSGGVPRLLNRAADAALMAAYAAGHAQVDAVNGHDADRHGSNMGICSAAAPGQSLSSARHAGSVSLEENVESTEPFDWSAAAPPPAAMLIYPPWEAPEMDIDGRATFAPEDVEEEEMVSIACSAAQSMASSLTETNPPATTGSEYRLPPPDLLERLEKAVNHFGPSAPESMKGDSAMTEIRSPQIDVEVRRLATMEKRLRDVLAPAETRVAELERRAARLVKPLEQMEERRQRMERACATALHMETRLSAYAEQIAHAAGDLQERSTALAAGMESGEQTRGRLTLLMDAAAAAGLESRVELNRQNEREMESRMEDARRCLSRSVREARETHAAMDELVVQASSDHARASARTEALRSEWQEMSARWESESAQRQEKTEQALRARLERVAVDFMSRQEEAEKAWHGRMERVSVDFTSRQEAAEQALHARLERVSADFISRQEAAETAAQALHGRMERGSADFLSRQEEAEQAMQARLDRVSADFANRHEEMIQALKADVQRQEEQISARSQGWKESFESTQEKACAAMQERLTTIMDEWSNRVHAAQLQHEEKLSQWQTVRSAWRKEADESVFGLQESLQSTVAKHRAAADTVHRDVQEWQKKIDQRHEALTVQWNTDLETLEARGADIQANLSQAAGRAEVIGETMHKTRRAVETVSCSVSGIRTELDAAEKQSAIVREQLDAAIRKGEELVHAAQATCGQVESLQRAGAQMLVDIGAHVERGQSLREQLSRGEEIARRMEGQMTAAAHVLKNLPDAVHAAHEQEGALARLGAEAREGSARLQSQHAAAATVARQVADATIAAHDLLEELRRTNGAAEEADKKSQSHLESMEQKLRGIAETLPRLDAARADGWAAAKRLEVLHAAATEESETLSEFTGRAEQSIQTIQEQTATAEAMVECLTSLQALLAEAAQLKAELLAVADGGRQLHEALASTSEAALEKETSLARQYDSVQQLIQSGEAMEERWRQTTRDFAAVMENVAAATASQEDLRKGHVEQSTQLARTLGTLQGQLDGVAGEMSRTLTRPAEVMRSVQEQTAQLESVCAAVRKVFGSLAQTSLQARKDIQAFEERSADATQRNAALGEETNRAAATLQQWVQEAIHVQARLEQTLKQSPTLAQTHPGELLKSVSRLAKPIMAPATVSTAHPDMGAKTPATRIEPVDDQISEIASILRDARAAKTAGGK